MQSRPVVDRCGPAIILIFEPHRELALADLDHPIPVQLALVIGENARDICLTLLSDHVHNRRDRSHRRCRFLGEFNAGETFRIFLFDECGADIAGLPARVVHHCLKEWDIVADALDLEAIKSVLHLVDRGGTIRPGGAELGDHRIVEHRDLAALFHACVIPDGTAIGVDAFGRRAIAREPADRRKEIAVGVLGVDAALDRPALDFDVVLAEGERLAGRNFDHFLDEIDRGDHLGHGMLDLQARVHFEKVEIALAVDDEFDRTGGVVTDGFRERDRLFTHMPARRLIEKRRWRFLNDFLIAPLNRAFALIQVNASAVPIAEDLDFDMAGCGDEFFDEDAIVTEAGGCFGFRAFEAFPRTVIVMSNAHAFATAAGGCLDHHGIADFAGDPGRFIGIGDQAHIARNGGHAGFGCDFFGRDLVAHRLDCRNRRADEGDTCRVERLSKIGVLGQEAVAGMHGFGAARSDRLHDLVDDDVGFCSRRRADMDGLIGHAHVNRIDIGIGIDGDRTDAHLLCRFDHPAGDLTAISDQDFFEHDPELNLPIISCSAASASPAPSSPCPRRDLEGDVVMFLFRVFDMLVSKGG